MPEREHIMAQIRRHSLTCRHYGTSDGERSELTLLDFFLRELAKARPEGQGSVEHALRHEIEELKKERHRLMITADKLNASSDALQKAVTGAIALIPSGTPASTPDADVLAFQANVDAQTSRLLAAEGPTPPTPPTP